MKLRWDWEIPVPELNTSVFLTPADFGGRHERSGVKNGDERLVALNNVAKSVIEGQRGLDPIWVFPYGKPDRYGKATPVHQMNDSAWKKARVRAAKKFQERFLRPAPPGLPILEWGKRWGKNKNEKAWPFQNRAKSLIYLVGTE